MLKRSLCILIFSSLIFSNNYEFWLGAGSVGTVIPEFKGDFAVKDASASQSTYYFKADVSGADSHMPFNLGVKANLNDIMKVKGKLDVNLSTSMGFSPLGGGAYVYNIQFIPSLDFNLSKLIGVGVGFGLGGMGYSVAFDVERESAGDIYMTFDDKNIYFDSETGLANATLSKAGLVMAPEFSLQLLPNSKIGLQFRYQQLMHASNLDDPWKITFTESSGDEPETVSVDYAGQYVSDLGTEFPKLDLDGTQFSLEFIYRFSAP